MTPRTLVLIDAGMVTGFRRAKPSLGQLHQALVHLYQQHPDVLVAVVADPSLKWDLDKADQAMFEGDIVAGAVVCAPAGALDGTLGFLVQSANRAAGDGHTVVAITDRAVPGVALGRPRNEAGRWLWDLDSGRTLEADAPEAVAAAAGGGRRRRRSR